MEEFKGRYAVFGCYCYYPSGGMSDLCGTFPTRAEANTFARELKQRKQRRSFDFRIEIHDLLKTISKTWKEDDQ
jgi:hypothetical protein